MAPQSSARGFPLVVRGGESAQYNQHIYIVHTFLLSPISPLHPIYRYKMRVFVFRRRKSRSKQYIDPGSTEWFADVTLGSNQSTTSEERILLLALPKFLASARNLFMSENYTTNSLINLSGRPVFKIPVGCNINIVKLWLRGFIFENKRNRAY